MTEILMPAQFVGNHTEKPTGGQGSTNIEENNVNSPEVRIQSVYSEQVDDQLDNSENPLRPTHAQNVASHLPSPDTYENALHGLLALGSGLGFNEGLVIIPREQEEARDCDTATLGIASDSLYDCGPDSTDDNIQADGVGDERIHPSSVPISSSSAGVTDAPQNLVLELLTYYRYHIAPWVSG
jgi:hypothetical protein